MRGLSQAELAARCALSQTQISYFEVGQRRPTLNQILRIASALDVSIQRLMTGSDRPGIRLSDIAIELRHLGIADLWVKDAVVPGAFRPAEEVIALAVSGQEPDPRILEAIPAVLAWNEIDPVLLRAYGLTTRPQTARRLAWLADIALAVDRRGGFPGGCRKEQLTRFSRSIRAPAERMSGTVSAARWRSPRRRPSGNAGGSATMRICSPFEQRARHLDELRRPSRGHHVRRAHHHGLVTSHAPDDGTRESGQATSKGPTRNPSGSSKRSAAGQITSTGRRKSRGGSRDGA